MTKELFICSSPHETKVAVLEEDSLVEVFHQRDTDVGLVGGIYKGRVSRVLPGMQSAFVDIGLERDAFLYVSDFFEDSDEYDRVVTAAELKVSKAAGGRFDLAPPAPETVAPPAPSPEPPVEQAAPDFESETPSAPPPASQSGTPATSEPGSGAPSAGRGSQSDRRFQQDPRERGRRRRRGRGFHGRPDPREQRPAAPPAASAAPSAELPSPGLELLPGESLARYGHAPGEFEEIRSAEAGAPAASSAPPAAASPEPAQEIESAVELTASIQPVEPQAQAKNTPGDPLGIPIVGAVPTIEDAPTALFSEPETEAAEPALDSATAAAGQSAPESATLVAEPVAVQAEPEAKPARAETDAVVAKGAPEPDPEDEVEAVFLSGNLRVAPFVVEPDAPAHYAAGAEAVAHAAPAADVETGTEEEEESEPEPEGESAEESAESADEASDAEGSEETEEGDEAEEAEGEGAEAETNGAESTEGQPQEGSASEGGGSQPVTGEGGAPGERSYTLRDSNQRPRFVPRRGRRGRGRFGPRPARPEGGGGRRPDFPRGGNEQAVQINEVLKEGQEILVQIAKEPLGSKGARITSHVALPGRYLVYMPTIQHTGVSRKIASEEERLRLRNIILEHRGTLTGGIIVRTAAAGRTEEELRGDMEFLGRLWAQIRERSERSKAPALIHRDLTLVERILRDTLSPDFKTIRVDNELEYQNVLEFVHRFQPALIGHVKLYTKDTPMFEEFGIQEEINKALKPKVWLKSGGYIVINQTEALVAIDVNTGKYVGKTNRLEDTIVKTNIDAVKEIVRQVRLRDLGGIIVIDFIDMDDRRNRAKVVQALEEALRFDRAPTKILSFNEFGLVALTRKRVKQSLERTLSEQCSYCAGSGWIKSTTTVCYEILEEVKKMAHEVEGKTLTLRVNPEVARALKSHEGALAAELETICGKDVVIKSDAGVHQERFEIF